MMHLDANNLYGWVICQPLPNKNFIWWEQAPNPPSLLTLLDKYDEKSKKGIILEVDLEYPQELHDLHNDYPCVAEKINVTNDMLSPYCSIIKDQHKISRRLVKKSIPTLSDKTSLTLQNLDLELKKVHRVLELTQAKWLKNTLILTLR